MAGATMVDIRVASATPNEYTVAIAMCVFTMVVPTMWLWLASSKPRGGIIRHVAGATRVAPAVAEPTRLPQLI